MPIVELQILDESALAHSVRNGGRGRCLIINARQGSTAILEDDNLALSFDRAGRLTGAWLGGSNYRRSLDNRVFEKQEGPKPGLSYRVRRELPPAEADDLLLRVRGLVAGYRALLDSPASRPVEGTSPDDCAAVRDRLDGVLACDPARLERDAELFRQIYRPINILPPDQYLAIVLQATEGCSYNRCAFCGFYRDRSFRIKSLPEFKRHIEQVRALFGQGISGRRSIFLADANALVIPQSDLVPIFDTVADEFAIEPAGLDRPARDAWRAEHPFYVGGVYSFVDAFTSRRKTVDDFRELAARGLRRVYIGLESGDGDLLRFLGKPNSPDDIRRLVEVLKSARVAVGLVVLAGAGGDRYASNHVRQTAELIRALPLDQADLIYFSELVDYPGSSYSALAASAGIRPLTVEEIQDQMLAIKSALQSGARQPGPKISYYDVREFIY